MSYKSYVEFKNTDIPWAKNIPNHWKVSKLKRIFKFEKGKNSNMLTEEYIKSNEGPFPVYSGQTKNNGIIGYIDSYDYDFENNVILVTTVGAKAMTTFLINGKLSLSQNCALIKLQSSKDLSDYYYYLCKILFNYERGLIPDIMQPSLRIGDLNAYNIIKPPIDEQKQIANYLDEKTNNIDEIIAKNKRLINLLEEKKVALINRAVTKGLNPNIPMKDSGIKWIGEIPEHWTINKLSYYFKQLKNKNISGSENNLLSLSYGRIIRKNIQSNEGLLPENFDTYNIIDKNDIVLRLTDLQNDKKSLRTGLVTERGIITSAYVTIRPISSKININYIHYLLHSYDLTKVFYNMGGGVRQNLNYKELSYLPCLEPPLEEQKEIAFYLDKELSKIELLINKLNEHNRLCEEYKSSLIHHVVIGKIDVTGEV